ncbi:MAG: right-handed parallel beta-helix repeat-containing protein, partial [Promethearchaeati archaeon]
NGTLYNNTIRDNSYGIRLENCNNILITENNITNNDQGINFEGCNNTISHNVVNDNDGKGITTEASSQEVKNNIIVNNTVFNNSENGIYLKHNSDKCKFNEITRNNVSNSGNGGIGLGGGAHNNTITSNDVQLNGKNGIAAIYVYESENNTLEGNIINYNKHQGLSLDSADFNLIFNNTIRENVYSGINLEDASNSNRIEKNDIIGNLNGIRIYNGDNNTVKENLISNNTDYGVDISSIGSNSDYNLVWKNYFINNTDQAIDGTSTNFWNSSTIGNYWDDYPGVDDSPLDGIGDSPYTFTGGSDYLPIWDDDNPKILINCPTNNSKQTAQSPEFDIEVIDPYTESLWYSIDNGIINITCNSSGTVDQAEWNSIWNSLDDGEQIQLTFYANDSFGHLGMNTSYLIKDAPPTINIISPLNNIRIGREIPEYTVEISDDSITQWYTLDLGLNNITFSTNGTFEQNAWEAIWDSRADGETIPIRFYANDTFGQISMDEISLIKDGFPTLNIISPTNGTEIERELFDFNIEIIDYSINNMWYTINGGPTKYSFSSNGTIDNEFLTVWDSKSDGKSIKIEFFVNDSLGQISTKAIYLFKTEPDKPSGGIPGYDLPIIIIIALSVVGIIYINQKRNK